MSADQDHVVVEQAQAAVTRAESEAAVRASDLARVREELARLTATHGVEDDRLIGATRAVASAAADLKKARAFQRASGERFVDTITAWLRPDPAQDVATLSADFPIVLLPVRIETRFARGARPRLLVRVYPDEIAADFHEPALTPSERQAGIAYWTSYWSLGDEHEPWRTLLADSKPQRAAWIVQAMTPSNIARRATERPAFPDPSARATTWTRPALARLLPDRWIVIGYRAGVEVCRGLGATIADPLALTYDPAADPDDAAETTDVSGHGLHLDTASSWTVDFQAALQKGMALSIPLTAEDIRLGFDRLIVTGVKSSLEPDAAAARLADVLDAHHYTRGFAFVPQGTPTNNTSEARAGMAEDSAEATFAIERGDALAQAGSSGRLFARALGIRETVVDHIEHAGQMEQRSAHAMAEALWPCTLGYFLDQMMDPVFSSEDIAEARTHYLDHVRGRGSLPAFRVGGTPYGILPVSALARWETPRNAGNADRVLPPSLLRMRALWLAAANTMPRIGRSDDPDADFLQTLGLDASTREVRIRSALGPDIQTNTYSFMGFGSIINSASVEIPLPFLNLDAVTRASLAAIGHDDWSPMISWLAFQRNAPLFRHELVANPLSETDALPFNYIRWVRTATMAMLREPRFTGDAPAALLYHFLRHAALTEYARLAVEVERAQTASAVKYREPELVGMTAAKTARETVAAAQQRVVAMAWDRFDLPVMHAGTTMTIAQYLLDPRGSGLARGYASALQTLEELPSAELERLFTETLDTCSHRLDAWITSIVSKRLGEMRARRPQGCHIGAYAWVEDLRPKDAASKRSITGREADVQHDNGGFIHAPSMNHASAAAVLRNAYLTRSGDEGARYAVDLSSERVRLALWVLDCVREGQPLGAVLGYRFERGLHDRRLDVYIDPLRGLYPLVADKSEPAGGDPVDAIAARNVVDGLRLREAWRTSTVPFATHPELPHSGAGRTAIEDELRRLDDAADAVADLLVSDAVYQMVRGNASGAGASLDLLAQGMRPPEPEIAMQPRGGTGLTHRVGVLLGTGAPLATTWAGIAATPRSTAEPTLDVWVGRLLGDPNDVICRVTVDGTAQTITLRQLALRPLDVLALSGLVQESEAKSEIDVRIAWQANAPAGAVVRIEYDIVDAVERSTKRTFPDLLEAATAIRNVIGAARPLAPKDLLPPERESEASSAVPVDLAADAAAAVAALQARQTALAAEVAAIAATAADSSPDLSALRNALVEAAALGVRSAFPASRNGSSPELRSDLLTRGRSVAGELRARLTKANEATAPAEKLRAVFGRDFMILGGFVPASQSELSQAVAHATTLTGGVSATRTWLQQAAPVRPALRQWVTLTTFAQALAGWSGELEAIQLPHHAGARWAALPFTEDERPHDGSVSIVLHRTATPAANEVWSGLIIDEWTEIIPRTAENTALAFHYDDPGAEAAQVVLLAVPPSIGPRWSLEALLDTLHETIDLARIRAVDLSMLSLGQIVPGIFLASNPANEAISTDFTTLRVDAATIARMT